MMSCNGTVSSYRGALMPWVKFWSSVFQLSMALLISITTTAHVAWGDEIDQDLGLRTVGGEVHAETFSGMLTTSGL